MAPHLHTAQYQNVGAEMGNPGTSDAIRQDLERFWDAKLQRARERYIQASAELHRQLLEHTDTTHAPLLDEIRRAEAEAFANYCRVLATFTELVAMGKVPKPEP